MIIVSASLLLSAIVIIIALIWASGFLFGAPFDSTDKKTLRKMIEFANPKKEDKIVDLGSGSGTIVIEFARRGFNAEGWEINPILIFISRMKIKSLGLEKKAKIHFGNFMKQNLSKFDIVSIFQISYAMDWLKDKLKKELKPKSKIISNTWIFKNWKPVKKFETTLMGTNVYLYRI